MKNPLMPQSRATNAYDLLSEIIDLIVAEPKRYNQTNWLHIKGNENFSNPTIDADRSFYPSCGTVGCVAGWTVSLKAPRGLTKENASVLTDVEAKAAWILGLSEAESDRLFSGAACVGTKPGTQAHADAGAEHIRRFQEKHEAKLKATEIE